MRSRSLAHRPALAVLLSVLSLALWSDVGAGGAFASEVRNPDGVAVIVGNKDYSDVGDVAYAHRDAEAIHRYVVDVLGFDPRNVRLVTDADFGQMRSLFGTEGRDRAGGGGGWRLSCAASPGGARSGCRR